MKSMRLASALAEANNTSGANNKRPMNLSMDSNAVKGPVTSHLKASRRPCHQLQQPRKSIY